MICVPPNMVQRGSLRLLRYVFLFSTEINLNWIQNHSVFNQMHVGCLSLEVYYVILLVLHVLARFYILFCHRNM